MESNLEILGLSEGDPYHPRTWSGSARETFLALRNRGVLRDAIDIDTKGLRRLVNGLREYSPDKRVWKQNFRKSPHQFKARTRNAAAVARNLNPLPDALLQIGATFDGSYAAPQLPLYCYLDSNCVLSERGGEQSFSYYASAKYKRMAFERERAIYTKARGIFVFSDHLRNSLIQDFGVPAARIHTVYAGVNIAVPATQPHADKAPVILFVGKDFERKGGPLLLKAFARVQQEIPAARLIVAGAELNIGHPNVETVGYIDKGTPGGEARLIDLYRQAAVFAMPSHFEPFGIVYAEAMHFGLPCVGVAHYAMPEIITQDVTGILIRPGNEHDLTQALLRLLKNPALARRMGEEGRRKAEQFRWEIVAEKMESTIRRDLAQDRSGINENHKEQECLRAVS